MIAAYLRVSTLDQNHDGQRAEVERWIERNGIDPAKVTWYADSETGTRMDRAALQRLDKDIASGKVHTVIVRHLDRLGRNMLDGMNVMSRWLKHGAGVKVTSSGIDCSTDVGQIIAAVLLGFAQMENKLRKERQKAGIAVAKERGIYKGRKAGSTKAKPTRAIELRDKGLSPAEIATAMGTSERTVWRYLAATA
ncbi:MAG TPA: recombinase family protein [Tepidisphaeraceae bacterium]|jgi:DNA invertase Pin-like site-specific DNA recombinase